MINYIIIKSYKLRKLCFYHFFVLYIHDIENNIHSLNIIALSSTHYFLQVFQIRIVLSQLPEYKKPLYTINACTVFV